MDKEFFNGMNLDEDITDNQFQQIVDGWEKVKDKMSKEEFINKFNEYKDANSDIGFMDDISYLNQVVNPFTEEKNEPISKISNTDGYLRISDVEVGNEGFNVIARIMSISSPKIFTSRKGKQGKLCNMQIADDTGELRLVLWTENIKHLKHVHEGDIVDITNIQCKEGYRGGKEFSLFPRSILRTIDESSDMYPSNILAFPVYEEKFVSIEDIVPDETVSIIGRLIRVPAPHSYESNGKKGKVTSLEIQDATGKIAYTLWNNDVKLIDSLELKEGDIVKILNEQARERNGEISLSHWDGRICKAEGDYDIPEYKENIIKIAEAREMKDVTLIGLVTKVQDVVEFDRADGSTGYVQSIEISDDSASIRVTLWGDDTKLKISKGDILKVVGGNIEYDDYATSGYRVNTNWNTDFKINPDEESDLINILKEYASKLGPIPIDDIQKIDDDDGVEVDIVGRLISLGDKNSFQRDDGSRGVVRSGNFADASGHVRVSFWDEKAESKLGVGKAYQIENARTKLGMYAVEINIGKTTRLIELSDIESQNIPSFEELEESLYEPRKIEDLDEEDMNIKVVARILDIQEAREFERGDGSKGLVGNMDIGDETGVVRVTLWDDKNNLAFSVGDAVKIQNPRVRFNENINRLELSTSGATNILAPSTSELFDLPDIEELQNILFISKGIDSLDEEDTNIKVSGTLNDVFAGKLLIPKCPHCNNNLEEDEEECSYCGNVVDEPKYLLMIPGTLIDGETSIQVTFFNDLVEQLLDMKQDELIAQYEEEGDLGFIESRVEDLNGLNLELLADVTFSDYDEELRLRPKKILNAEY